jgi:hypothetical protein
MKMWFCGAGAEMEGYGLEGSIPLFRMMAFELSAVRNAINRCDGSG